MYQLLNYNIDVVDVATSEAEEVTQVCFDMWQGMGRVDLIESMLHADWLIIPFMRYGIEDLWTNTEYVPANSNINEVTN